jgi:DNA-binding GntR family transcriptional regulator
MNINGNQSNFKIQSIEYQSLSDITAVNLREAIVSGELEPGVRITENEIADGMGVSRVVVREAILMLIQEGLLTKERNKYTKVVKLDKKDIADIFDLRVAIEQASAKRCIGQKQIVEELMAHSKHIKELSNTKNGNYSELMHADMDFHSCIVTNSNNDRLLKVWKEIYGPILILLFRYIENGRAFKYSHGEIIEAFESKDEKLVNLEIRKHIEDTKKALMDNF